MLKRVMMVFMTIITAGKFAAMTWMLSTAADRLPVTVYIISGAVVLVGLILICKNIVKTSTKREIAWFYGVNSFAVAVNLLLMKLFSRIELNLIDLAVIGSVLDIVFGVVVITMTLKESRYVQIKVDN